MLVTTVKMLIVLTLSDHCQNVDCSVTLSAGDHRQMLMVLTLSASDHCQNVDCSNIE